jgi:selenide,water dikinase
VDLAAILKRFPREEHPQVLIGLERSDDAGVYRLTDEIALVQTVDFITPLTDDPYLFGKIAAANSLSDIYAMGGRPLTALNLCCFPGEGIPLKTFEAILQGGLDKIHEAGAVLIGGHTVQDNELKYGLSVTGIVHPDRVISNAGAAPGDCLILTKPIGSGVIFGPAKAGVLPEGVWVRVLNDMAQLNRTACELMLEFPVHACTDITGFGFAGHAMEMACSSRVRMKIDTGKIPHYAEALELIRAGGKTRMTSLNRELVSEFWRCGSEVPAEEEQLLFDPQTSGGLLISLPSEHAHALCHRLRDAGVTSAAMVGEVSAAEKPLLDITRT